MFTPLPMQRTTLFLLREEAPTAALALARCGTFNPDVPQIEEERLSEHLGDTYRAVYRSAATRLEKILKHLALEPEPLAVSGATETVPQKKLEELDGWLGQTWRECSRREETERGVQEALRELEQLDRGLDHFESLDIDLRLLRPGGFRFLDIQIGTVPSSDIARLGDALALIGYTVSPFSAGAETSYVVLAGAAGSDTELDSVLSAASFTRLELPEAFQGHPHQVRQRLAQRRDELQAQHAACRREVEASRASLAARLSTAARTLSLASPYGQLSLALRRHGGLARVTGWVPSSRVDELRWALEQDLKNRFVLEVRDPLPAERRRVPSAIRHPALLRPFAQLVKTYGIPRYGEFDPTWLFALSFIAMFGMMFGDIGHGLVIATAGLVAHRPLRGFGPFVVAIGCSSIVFGFLYGSLFGYEELIEPLWIAPLSDPARMLVMALYWGIAFILIATAVTIRNRLREGAVAQALLDGSGLAGAAFYGGLIFAASRWLGREGFGVVAGVAVVAPLLVILWHKWHTSQMPWAERIVVVLLEVFDTLLGFVANTLSFLRVAAFSLNHVALAVAVFALANMMGPAGHWVMLVAGNLFILVLEGAIVTIQVLRLEYYEGFSRFFRADGREFRPLELETVPRTA